MTPGVRNRWAEVIHVEVSVSEEWFAVTHFDIKVQNFLVRGNEFVRSNHTLEHAPAEVIIVQYG